MLAVSRFEQLSAEVEHLRAELYRARTTTVEMRDQIANLHVRSPASVVAVPLCPVFRLCRCELNFVLRDDVPLLSRPSSTLPTSAKGSLLQPSVSWNT